MSGHFILKYLGVKFLLILLIGGGFAILSGVGYHGHNIQNRILLVGLGSFLIIIAIIIFKRWWDAENKAEAPY